MFDALEAHWDADSTWVREFVESGLTNCRLLLRLNRDCLTFLATDPSEQEYGAWLMIGGMSPRLALRSQRNLAGVRRIAERKVKLLPQAIAILEDDPSLGIHPMPAYNPTKLDVSAEMLLEMIDQERSLNPEASDLRSAITVWTFLRDCAKEGKA